MQVNGSLEHQAKSEEDGGRRQDRLMEKKWEGETHSLIPQLFTEHLLVSGLPLSNEDGVNGTAAGGTLRRQGHLVHEKLSDFQPILFHRLHFSIPKLIPSKTLQIVAASECLAHGTPVLYRLGLWSSNLSACIKSWRSNT